MNLGATSPHHHRINVKHTFEWGRRLLLAILVIFPQTQFYQSKASNNRASWKGHIYTKHCLLFFFTIWIFSRLIWSWERLSEWIWIVCLCWVLKHIPLSPHHKCFSMNITYLCIGNMHLHIGYINININEVIEKDTISLITVIFPSKESFITFFMPI